LSKVNKFLVLFVLMVSGIIWSTWQFMQSEMFASYAADKITNYISKRTNLAVNFERIEFQLYPIGSILKSVEVMSDEKSGIKNLYASEVGVYFDFLDFFSNKITVKKIGIVSAEASFLEVQKKNRPKAEDNTKLIEEIKKEVRKINHKKIEAWVTEHLPIELESLEFIDSIIRFGSERYDISHASVSIFNKLTELKGKLENVDLSFLKLAGFKHLDSFEIDIQISEADFRLRKLELREGLSTLKATGTVKNENQFPLNIEFNVETGLSRIVELSKTREYFRESSGFVEINGTLKNDIDSPGAEYKILADEVVCDYFSLNSLEATGFVNMEKVVVKSLKANKRNGSATLLSPVDLISVKNTNLLLSKVPIKLDRIHTNDALWFLREDLHILKGELTGNVEVNFLKNNIEFIPEKGFRLNDFELVQISNVNDKILKNDGFTFKSGKLILKNLKDLALDVAIKMEKTNIVASGLISEDRLDLEIKEGFVDFEELGPISGTMLKGAGSIISKIYGPYENVVFDFFPDVSDFNVVNLNLGRLSGRISLHLRELDLFVQNVKAKYKSTNYSGNGWLNFDKKNGLDLDIKIEKGFYSDTLEMLSHLVSQLGFTLPKAVFEYSADVKVSGPFDEDKLVVKGSVDGKELNFFLEDFNSLNADFSYFGTGFEIKNVNLRKNAGQLRGSFSMNLMNDYLEYDATASGMRLSDFKLFKMLKLGIDSELFGEFYGTGTPKDFSSRTHLKSLNAKIGEKKVGDSFFTIYNNGPDVFMTLNLLNGEGSLESFVYLNEDKKKNSYIKAVVNSEDVRKVMGILSSHNITNPDVSGKLDVQLYSQFDFFNPYLTTTSLKIDELNLRKGSDSYRLLDGKDEISIKNGEIEKFDIQIKGTEGFYSLGGTGQLAKTFSITQEFQIGAHFAELLSEKIRGSSGKISAKAKLLGKNKTLENFMELEGSKIAINHLDVPGSFIDTSFKVLIENNNILIQEAKSNYGNGQLKLEGAIETMLPYPRLDLYWEIDNSRFPLFSRSNVVLSGNGKISGDSIPYKLYGDVSIFHGEIIDSLDQFQSEVGMNTEYQKFIPRNIGVERLNLVDLDLGVNIVRPIRVFNSLTELLFDGEIRLFGEPKTPEIVGQLRTVAGKSKFKFKGYEFNLIEGEILFPKGRARNRPDLKFAGVTDINNYNVKVEVIGPADKIAIGLSSTPPLSQEDIKSLLAIGVTTDVSKGLDDSQRQSMTTIGVGSMIFEQFKINQELNSSLGLRLSVLPEITEDETSLLQGKSGVSDTSSTRVKSATKIKVQKKLTDKVDLSVSSTVGGSIEQKQEMNINFQINKKISVEGIYEVKSNEENEAESPDSIGVDLKWKTSF
jgi:translocation and assembly module TamB